jgi:hypothetical protein
MLCDSRSRRQDLPRSQTVRVPNGRYTIATRSILGFAVDFNVPFARRDGSRWPSNPYYTAGCLSFDVTEFPRGQLGKGLSIGSPIQAI